MDRKRFVSESDDSDIIKLCSVLLPEIERIVKDRRVPEGSQIRILTRDLLQSDGTISVLRELTQATRFPLDRKTHPKGVASTEVSKALVSLFNQNVQEGNTMVRDVQCYRSTTRGNRHPTDGNAHRRNPKNVGATTFRRSVTSSASKVVPVKPSFPPILPPPDRRVYFLQGHEKSDMPYLAQSDFPPWVTVCEERLFYICPLIRFAFEAKRIGRLSDPEDRALYDPETTSKRKRCIAQSKIVYLSEFIASSYLRTEDYACYKYNLQILDGWTGEKLWLHTMTWVLFVDDRHYIERIASESALDELCMLGNFLGASKPVTAGLRNSYRVYNVRSKCKGLAGSSDQPDTATSLANKASSQSYLSPADEPARKRIRDNWYVADDVQNDIRDLGWRLRDA
ncbi:hypothetical protein SBOR_8993 [Sclerotinia borealis F-4128]|uniref:Uncharacterized protein n=1 Tax=Sclerotinia borealis (strain F-4128) TaxID=1432307 RepID=W9C7Q3_SCLBF|nr:hypothetical protein SBOR_8993 [Sclerotinia borealis F-4128]